MARVVLAEDDATMVQLLSTLLGMEGFEVTAVERTADVELAVQQVRPDALVLDMIFAEQNGLEVVERIRRSEQGRDLYVVMMSGLNAREECLRRGADDFLVKPFMPEELTGLLHSRLRPEP